MGSLTLDTREAAIMRLVSIATLTTVLSTASQRFVFPDDKVFLEKLAEEKRNNLNSDKNHREAHNLNTHDDFINEIEDKMMTKSPACKENEEYCSDPIFYPKDAIQNALKKQYRTLKTLLPSPAARGRSSLDVIPLESRSGNLNEWRNLCDTNTSFINPKVARNKDGVSMYLVNSDLTETGEGDRLSEFSQQVRITRCAGDHGDQGDDHTGGQCGDLGELTTRCQQQYTLHRLVALDPRGLELIVDEFRFPSSCSCLYRPILI